MAIYTIVTTRISGGTSTYVLEYAHDAAVIADARQVLCDFVVAISIARGSPGALSQRLGAWVVRGDGALWAPDEPSPLAPAAGAGLSLACRRPA